MKTIAVDIDEVLLPHFQDLIAYYNGLYGTKLTLADNHPTDTANWGVDNIEVVVKRVQKFFETDEFINSKPFAEAKDAVKQLSLKYRLIVVTGRDGLVQETTNNWLNLHFKDLFDEVHFTNMYSLNGSNRLKVDVCKEAGVNWLIDDSYAHVTEVAEQGITGVLFGDYIWNNHSQLPKNVVRAKDWQEVLEYFANQ